MPSLSEPSHVLSLTSILVGVLVALSSNTSTAAAQEGDYSDLVALFEQWREFERPEFVDGVPE